jgi:hypothetical protein
VLERFEGVNVSDFRNTIIGCTSATCRFNIEANPERTCALKLIAIDQTGRCRMAEARPIPQLKKETYVAMTRQGHFEGGVWVE